MGGGQNAVKRHCWTSRCDASDVYMLNVRQRHFGPQRRRSGGTAAATAGGGRPQDSLCTLQPPSDLPHQRTWSPPPTLKTQTCTGTCNTGAPPAARGALLARALRCCRRPASPQSTALVPGSRRAARQALCAAPDRSSCGLWGAPRPPALASRPTQLRPAGAGAWQGLQRGLGLGVAPALLPLPAPGRARAQLAHAGTPAERAQLLQSPPTPAHLLPARRRRRSRLRSLADPTPSPAGAPPDASWAAGRQAGQPCSAAAAARSGSRARQTWTRSATCTAALCTPPTRCRSSTRPRCRASGAPRSRAHGRLW